ncbi:cyclic-phosphate processing receiver domain-containing protein [Rhodococcus sp. MALMAid1271]|uniref:cyclic-phosphate processing receiver domain-containing protein n=1 Tax=Rhodococcus sp. MALMAid1271 TaxID=3411744 RepID=UPI003BA0F52B
MKLFIDDERPAPEGWELALTSAEAIAMIDEQGYKLAALEAVSFDHDLGGDDTTRPVVLWMCENDYWPESVYVHTGNPIGEEWLVGMVRRYAPAGTLKGYGLNYWGTGPDAVIRHTEAS